MNSVNSLCPLADIIDVVNENHMKYVLCLTKNSPKVRTAASLVLRGANDFMCDEMERSVHDALCVVKRVLESKSVVPGGGAVEAALSIYLENFASSLVSYLTYCSILYWLILWLNFQDPHVTERNFE